MDDIINREVLQRLVEEARRDPVKGFKALASLDAAISEARAELYGALLNAPGPLSAGVIYRENILDQDLSKIQGQIRILQEVRYHDCFYVLGVDVHRGGPGDIPLTVEGDDHGVVVIHPDSVEYVSEVLGETWFTSWDHQVERDDMAFMGSLGQRRIICSEAPLPKEVWVYNDNLFDPQDEDHMRDLENRSFDPRHWFILDLT